MTLIAVVLVFLLMQYGKGVSLVQQDQWFFSWAQWLGKTLGNKIPAEFTALLIIILPALAAAVACLVIDTAVWGIPLLASLTLILAYSLGRGDFGGLLNDYLASWRNGDLQSAYLHASKFSHGQLLTATEDAASLHRHAVQAILYQSFERWFVVIFWLILAGPFGVLFYRFCFLLVNDKDQQTQADLSSLPRVIYWLEWLPLRLFGLSAAVVGNFVSCNKFWLERLMHEEVSTEQRLMDYGLAALGDDTQLACQAATADDPQAILIQGANQLDKLRELLDRMVVLSVVVISLIIFV